MANLTSSTNPTRPLRRGFSLAEGLVASTVLAIAVVGIAGPLGAASEQSKIVRERSTALVLARELLEEVSSKPLCDTGGVCHLGAESGETDRSKYDSADDFHGYKDSTADLRTMGGTRLAFDANAVYSRSVTVEYRATAAGASASSGDFGVVTVAVTTPHKQVVTIARLLCKGTFGP